MKLYILFFWLAIVLLPIQMSAQTDTLMFSEKPVKVKKAERHHSPHKATFYSAVFPGLGQIYNKKYWKLPIIYGGIGALIYAIDFNSTFYNKYKNAYRDFIIRDPGNKSYAEFVPVNMTIEDVENLHADWFESALDSKKKFYKRYRDMSYFGLVAIYVISMIDASVDAHFKTFDISDDLSMTVEPVMIPDVVHNASPSPGLQLQFRF